MPSLEEQGFKLFKQGAEGKLYSGTYLGKSTVAKERFPKSYRHPELDTTLTRERIKAEARSIVRCKSVGIRTPTLYLVDFERRCIFMENVENSITVKEYIFKLTEKTDDKAKMDSNNVKLEKLTQKIGAILSRMHKNNIIHGDLTTSNMLLQSDGDSSIAEENAFDSSEMVLIDFGLSHVDSSAEDKGVDLYVLERALTSTHSVCPHLFASVLEVYRKQDKAGSREVLERYEDVRARGRKRTMVG